MGVVWLENCANGRAPYACKQWEQCDVREVTDCSSFATAANWVLCCDCLTRCLNPLMATLVTVWIPRFWWSTGTHMSLIDEHTCTHWALSQLKPTFISVYLRDSEFPLKECHITPIQSDCTAPQIYSPFGLLLKHALNHHPLLKNAAQLAEWLSLSRSLVVNCNPFPAKLSPAVPEYPLWCSL